jgi:hypothetical protein
MANPLPHEKLGDLGNYCADLVYERKDQHRAELPAILRVRELLT